MGILLHVVIKQLYGKKNYHFKINDQHYNFTDIMYIAEMMMMMMMINQVSLLKKRKTSPSLIF